MRFTDKYKYYLLGRRFKVRTDHSSLTWLLRFREPQGQLARWLESLSAFDMEVCYRPGPQHGNADALSRLVVGSECRFYAEGVPLEHLPCEGCPYCQLADQNWWAFRKEVDDVVPLVGSGGEVRQLVVDELAKILNDEEGPWVSGMEIEMQTGVRR